MVTLEVITELDYETITLHVMELAVTDKPIAEGDTRVNTGTARVVVEVIDVADQPPMWTNIFASREFDELEPQVSKSNNNY